MPTFYSYFNSVEIVSRPGQLSGWTWENPENAINNDDSIAYFKPNPNLPQTSDGTRYFTPYLRLKGLNQYLPDDVLSRAASFNIVAELIYDVSPTFDVGSGIGFSVSVTDPANNFESPACFKVYDKFNNLGYELYNNNKAPRWLPSIYKRLLAGKSFGKAQYINFLIGDIHSPDFKIDLSFSFSFLNYNPNIHRYGIRRIYLITTFADPTTLKTKHTFVSASNIAKSGTDENYSFFVKTYKDAGVFDTYLGTRWKILPSDWEWRNFSNAFNKDRVVSSILPPGDISTTNIGAYTYQSGNTTISMLLLTQNALKYSNITPKITSDTEITGVSFYYAKRGYSDAGNGVYWQAFDDLVALHNSGILGKNVANTNKNDAANWNETYWYDGDQINNYATQWDNAFNKPDLISSDADYGGQFAKWGNASLTKTMLNDNNFGVIISPRIKFSKKENINNDPTKNLGIDDAFIEVHYKQSGYYTYLYPGGTGYPLSDTDLRRLQGVWTGIASDEIINQPQLNLTNPPAVQPNPKPIVSSENIPVHLLNYTRQFLTKPIISSENIPVQKLNLPFNISNFPSFQSLENISNIHKIENINGLRTTSIASSETISATHEVVRQRIIKPDVSITSSENVSKPGLKLALNTQPKSIATSETLTSNQELTTTSNLVLVNALFQEFYSQDKDLSEGSLNYTWDNPDGAKTKNDDSVANLIWDGEGASLSYIDNELESDYLYALNLDLTGYDIPDDAEIKGIEIKINRVGQSDDPMFYAYDSTVQLTLNDVLIGNNKAKVGNWPSVDVGLQEATYGSLTDTWGLTLTGADVKNATFGVALNIFFKYDIRVFAPMAYPPGSYNFGVDSINLSLIYEPAIPPPPPNSILPTSIDTLETIQNSHTLVRTEIPAIGCMSTPFLDHFSIDREDLNAGSTNYSWFNLEGVSGSGAAYLEWDSVDPETVPTEDLYSDYLYVQNILGSNVIPDNYEITGITVRIKRKGQSANGTDWYAYDSTVQLVLNDVLIGTNKANTIDKWPTTFQTATYGSSSDTWGTSLLGSDVNNSTFGVAIGIKFNHTSDQPAFSGFDFEVDNVDITICYQPIPEDLSIYPGTIETQETTISLDTTSQHKLIKSNVDPVFYTRIFSPAYEVGYYDVLALSRDVVINPVKDISINSLDTNYLFAANNLNLNYLSETQLGNRLAGEGANPNTFKINAKTLNLDFTIPIKVESWGYVDNVFSAIYDYFILGHKGNSTTFVGRFKYTDDTPLSNVSEIYIDNIADFMGMPTPFNAYIRSDDGSEAQETVVVNYVDKINKKLELDGNTQAVHIPSNSYIWATPPSLEEDREASFSLFSLREGLLSGCMIDKISLNMTPGNTLEANVSIKFTNLDRNYQSILHQQFDEIVSNVNKRKPNYLINASTIRVESTSPTGGSFLLGTAKDAEFFRGFEEINLRDFTINQITLEFSNNLQPVYSLNSTAKSFIDRFDENRQPYAYYSNGRSITGTIKYTSPMKPWLFTEKLSGPSKINKTGLVFNFGSFKLTLPEIIWSPQSAESGMDQNLQKTVNFEVVVNNLTFDPYLEPTGQF